VCGDIRERLGDVRVEHRGAGMSGKQIRGDVQARGQRGCRIEEHMEMCASVGTRG
jgi:hypothetical protein